MNLYTFNPELCSSFLGNEENLPNIMGNQDPFPYYPYCNDIVGDISAQNLYDECQVPRLSLLDVGEPIEVPDIPDTCFNFISNLLREEGSDDRPGATLHDYMAAQSSYNKSLDAALTGETCSFLANQYPQQQQQQPLCHNLPNNCIDDYLNLYSRTSVAINPNDGTCSNNNNNNKFVQNSLVGNSSSNPSTNCGCSSDFVNTLVRNVPFDGIGVRIGPSNVALISGREKTQHDLQGLNLIPNSSNWEFSHDVSVADALNRGDILPCDQGGDNYQQWDLSLSSDTSSTQFPPALMQSGLLPSNCRNSSAEDLNRMVNSLAPISENGEIMQEFGQCDNSGGRTRGRKHGGGDDRENGEETGRSNKLSAPSNEVFEQIEKYGDVLLCPEGRNKPAGLCSTLNKTSGLQNGEDQQLQKDGMSSAKGSKKRGNKNQLVELKDLLTRCAQCVARVDLASAYEILKQIRQHSSPYGGYLQRVAHYLANGLEARLEGRGFELTLANEQVSPSEVLKANRVYVASVPFKIMSYYTTNKTIASLVEEAPSIHIIDFGIFYGLQWPCIIQNLSKRPNGPPRLRITGIDFPQRGFRPAERVEETGRCLAKYCERYNVPFEYHGIAKKWETIELEDLRIERNEPLAVNCLYRSHNLLDESVVEHSPKDAFLNLVRKINPDIFMHGIVNSTSSVPFFLNRFKEALFHYTALFDLFEATMSREDNERMLLESKLYGNQALNVIACEGAERVERPETYKQWQVRTQRAGFVQVPLDRELLKRARAMVRRNFREEFSYDEDCHWVVQGWKGRILYAISCWKPQEV